MTSTDVAATLLRDLACVAGGPVAATRFAFVHDFDSATRFPDLPYDPAGPSSRYAVDDRPGVVAVVDAAAATIARHVPSAFALVDTQLDRVLLRRCDALDGATSSSNRARVGICVLTNIDRSPDRVLTCVEALVHEAVHQHLYRIEMADGAFCDLAASRRYRSPWSGNRIPLHSLVHACFVYYALLGLWCAGARSIDDAGGSTTVRDRIARILFGYAFIGSIVDDAAFPRAAVEPAILAAIHGIAEVAASARLQADTQPSIARALDEGDAWIERLAARLARLAGR